MCDDVYTIPLPGSDLVLTRYLYIKEEVRIALLFSILNKNDDAMYWAYELYHSGFKHELLNLIWKIYYDFFATLNPSFEQYLVKKQKKLLNTGEERIVSAIIQTLLFRTFNTDIWCARNIASRFILDIEYAPSAENLNYIEKLHANMNQWVSKKDYRSIIQWIYNEKNIDTNTCIYIYNICLDIFNIKSKKRLSQLFESIMNMNVNVDIRTILLAKIMTLFTRKKEHSLYISVDPADVIQYETISRETNMLEKVYSQCGGIDQFNTLSLFKLTRGKFMMHNNLENIYRCNWEYHAAFAPIWSQRIRQYGGYVDYNKKKVIFTEEPDDDLMQKFYENFGLEPDEQKKEIQEKSIGQIIAKYDWKWFSEKYRNNGLIEIYDEELEDFDQDKLTY